MSNVAEQIRCPSCGGVQEMQAGEHYECRFCLAPFTYRHAQEAENRQIAEIKAWVEQRIGSQGQTGDGGIDASSRAYLFRTNLLPSLQTAHDRALEAAFGFEQFPLLPSVRPSAADARNPLLQRRDEVLTLRELRARLASPDVQTFAVTEDDRCKIAALDNRLEEIVGLSNAAHAAMQGTSEGFAAARHNLEALLASGHLDADVADRYRALARFASLMERALASRTLTGAALAPEAEGIAEELTDVATRLEHQDRAALGDSLAAIAARKEANRAAEFGRMLRSYDAIVRRADIGFVTFVEDTLAILGHAAADDGGGELFESCAGAFRALRGEVPARVHESFDWARPLAEGRRKGKWLRVFGLGFLGLTEDISDLEEMFVPFWLVEAGGQVWLVDAARAVDTPAFPLEGAWKDLGASLGQAVPVRKQRGLIMPTVTATRARQLVQDALRAKGAHNTRLSEPALAMVPAAKARLRTARGKERTVLSCLADRLQLRPDAVAGLAVTRRLQERFQ